VASDSIFWTSHWMWIQSFHVFQWNEITLIQILFLLCNFLIFCLQIAEWKMQKSHYNTTDIAWEDVLEAITLSMGSIAVLKMVSHYYQLSAFNVKFVGRCYTARPGAPTVVSGKHDQKVHSWVVFWMYWCHCRGGRKEECSRRLGHSRRNLVLQILFLFLAECNPLSQSTSAGICHWVQKLMIHTTHAVWQVLWCLSSVDVMHEQTQLRTVSD